jgi:hypothetical protein
LGMGPAVAGFIYSNERMRRLGHLERPSAVALVAIASSPRVPAIATLLIILVLVWVILATYYKFEDLFCELSRPNDALAAIGRMVADTSPYGAMQMESVRLEAAEQLKDTKQVSRSLDYLRTHRTDAPATYEQGLIVVNQLDRAAHELVSQLLDVDQRQRTLLGVQAFAPAPGTQRDTELDARQRAVIAGSEVQAAIRKVGRAESYRLEER